MRGGMCIHSLFLLAAQDDAQQDPAKVRPVELVSALAGQIVQECMDSGTNMGIPDVRPFGASSPIRATSKKLVVRIPKLPPAGVIAVCHVRQATYGHPCVISELLKTRVQLLLLHPVPHQHLGIV